MGGPRCRTVAAAAAGVVKRGTRFCRDMRRERGTGGGLIVVVGQDGWLGEGGFG